MSVGFRMELVRFWPQLLALLAFAQISSAQETPPTSTPIPVPTAPVVLPLKERIKIETDKLHFSYVRDDHKVQSERESKQEFDAYNDVLIHARQFTMAELMFHARADVTFADLLKPVRKDFQYKLLLIEGRLKQLRSIEPNIPLREAGIKELYEGWIFPQESGVHMHDPMCVLLTELPEGLKPQMDYRPAKMVRFPGYSFKLMQYESQNPDPKNPGSGQYRRAPLLMGRSIIVDPDPDNDASGPWRTTFIPSILIGLTLILGILLTLIYLSRRGDRHHEAARQQRINRNPFDGPVEQATPPSEPTS